MAIPDSAPDRGTAFLAALFEQCVLAANLGMRAIRRVQSERELDNNALASTLKDPTDSRTALTAADVTAQEVIVATLRSLHPSITLVCEEDDEPEASSLSPLAREILATSPPPLSPEIALLLRSIPDEYADISLGEIVVFVDPVDGTREFVENRLGACQTLVGIAWRGRPVAGVMGLPFHDGAVGVFSDVASCAAGAVVCGIIRAGTAGFQSSSPHKTVLAVSALGAKKESDALRVAREAVGAEEEMGVGACGNKVLHVLTGAADAALFNLATSLWDTCATTAVVCAAGGRVTTLAGFPIAHFRDSPVGNAFGVLVSGPRFGAERHDAVCERLRAAPEVLQLFAGSGLKGEGAQSVDITRELDGEPFTAEGLAKAIGTTGVVSYSSLDRESVRYKQSRACRIRLEYDSDEGRKRGPASVFYKRVVLRELPHALAKAVSAPYKISRDVRSQIVEANVLASGGMKEFLEACEGDIRVSLPYRAERLLCESSLMDSRFGLLLFDFCSDDGWVQYGQLSDEKLKLVLSALAKWHAFFWLEDSCKVALEGAWDVGCYWQPEHQPKTILDDLEGSWERFMTHFENELPALNIATDTLSSLGLRLKRVALEAQRRAHGSCTTLLHGDAKAPNFFFRGDQPNVLGVIDLQWTGGGLPGTDIAYCIAASMAAPSRGYSCENVSTFLRDVISHYHRSLLNALVQFGKSKDADDASERLSLVEFEKQFIWSFLDLAVVVISEHWRNMTPDILRRRGGAFVFNAYNKDMDVALWFVQAVALLLNLAEKGQTLF